MYWQDLFANYLHVQALYNSAAINFGGWDNFIPGWFSPHGHLTAEPFVWVLPAYLYMVLGGSMLGGYLMRRTRQRWPRISNLQLIAVCFVFAAVFDMVFELAWLRMGMYS